jgi:type II secretory pathway pseudopilin PulG
MSSSASISAAKKRRANQVQPPTMPQPMMQRPGSAPAPSLANMTPAQRQQFMIQQQQQQQQRMLQQQQQMQQQSAQKPLSNQSTSSKTGNQKSSSKVPDLTWPMPPIYLMKQMDTILFQQSKTIDELKNRLNCIETGTTPTRVADFDSGSSGSQLILEQTKHSLLVDDEFVSGIVDNIMTNSNLSEIIEQIDTVQTENKELRELLHAQQKTINEMNIMLLKLISQSLSQPVSVPAASVPLPAPVPSSEQPNEECQDEEEDAVADADEDADEDAVADADANDDANAENNIQLDVIETKSKSKSKK